MKAAYVCLIFLALTACGKTEMDAGKAEITSDCSMNGGGDVACVFKNTGSAKGSTCQYIALTPKKDDVVLFSQDESRLKILNAMKEAVKKSGISEVKGDQTIPPMLMFLLLNKNIAVSDQEVCSGIVEAGDIRESKTSVAFMQLQPHEGCVSLQEMHDWGANCGLTTIPREQVAESINEAIKALKQY